MDQVKVYLGVAKKHHFWILAVVVVVTAVVVWTKAKNSLAAQYEADKRTIDSAEGAVTGAGNGEKVNESFTKKVEQLHGDLKDQVFEAWKELYEHQVALFKWPVKETDNEPIDLNKLKPDEEIPQYVRIFYNENVVREEWEELLAKVNIRRPREEEESTGEDSDSDEAPVKKRGTEYEGLVVWNEPLREAIINRYYTPNAAPSTTRLRLMQEDAWLFDSLTHIINAVNGGATDPLRAPIKQIDVLDVAQWAIAASLQSGSAIFVPGGAKSAAVPATPMAAAVAPSTTGTGTSAPADNDNELIDGRYLDEKGEPLKAGASQPFAEFKQMFVYMKFVMDQRRIPDLVAASANAPLPIETRQIRVKTLKDGDLFPAGGGMMGGGGTPGGAMAGPPSMGGGPDGKAPPSMGMMPQMGGGMPPGMGGGMPPGMGGGMPPGMMGGGGMGPRGMGGGMGGPMGGPMGGETGRRPFGFGPVEEGAVETTDYDAIVELSGVIYLYQPPDITKLGQGAASSPDKRSFGVPKTSVKVPGTGGGFSSSAGPK